MPINVILSPPLSQHRDLRSTSLPYKRQKDYSEKWSQFGRPSSNLHSSPSEENVMRMTEDMQYTSLLSKPWNSSVKTHKIAKAGWSANKLIGRPNNRNNIDIDDTDSFIPDLSYSHSQQVFGYNSQEHDTVHTTKIEPDMPDFLYSFDSKGPSPGVNGRSVELEKLVEIAEKKWEGKMTDQIVEGEYEVLDTKGENITLTRKGKRCLKQKSRAPQIQDSSEALEEDDGFELI